MHYKFTAYIRYVFNSAWGSQDLRMTAAYSKDLNLVKTGPDSMKFSTPNAPELLCQSVCP